MNHMLHNNDLYETTAAEQLHIDSIKEKTALHRVEWMYHAQISSVFEGTEQATVEAKITGNYAGQIYENGIKFLKTWIENQSKEYIINIELINFRSDVTDFSDIEREYFNLNDDYEVYPEEQIKKQLFSEFTIESY